MREIKTSAGSGNYHWNWKEFEYLVHILKGAKDFNGVLNAFIDLHTQKEIAEIIRRVIIASYLNAGMTYNEISELSGASHNTIAKINLKMMRSKTLLPGLLKTGGSYHKFKKLEESDQTKKRDLLSNTLAKKNILNLLK